MNCSSFGTEFSDESIPRSKCFNNLLVQFRIFFKILELVRWAETLPEELVIEMASTVKLDGLSELGKQFVITFLKGISCLLLQIVVISDVGNMMLTVVILHQLFR